MYKATAGPIQRKCEGISINKLNTHCIKGKGWRETLPCFSEDTLEAAKDSVHPTAYSALQAHPGLQSCILVSATLVHGHGEVGDHLKA